MVQPNFKAAEVQNTCVSRRGTSVGVQGHLCCCSVLKGRAIQMQGRGSPGEAGKGDKRVLAWLERACLHIQLDGMHV